MSDNLTKEQRKRRKKKEALKKKKADEKASEVNGRHKEEAASVSVDNPDESFESELCWCIEQLELGIKNKKPSKDEAQRAEKLTKILKSEKTAKVRKRQMMHNTFGDYRKKMSDDLKRASSATATEPKITAVSDVKLKKSIYLKTKAALQVNSHVPDANAESSAEKLNFQQTDNSFLFAFPDPQ